jgi:uncharacterized protein
MYRQMRRSDRAITPEEAYEILAKGEYGILSLSGDDRQPYGVPISYAVVGDVIYVHAAKTGQKLELIAQNGKVAFTVVGKTTVLPGKFSTEYESVMAFGTATKISGDEKEEALYELIKKYSPEFLEEGKAYINRAGDATTVIKIVMDHYTGKARR